MVKDKESFLKKVALIPSLNENRLSLIFALYPNIDVSKREKFVENISLYYKTINEENRKSLNKVEDIRLNSIENWIGKDLRIKRIKLKSIRGFPNETKPFGIDFSNNEGNPQSMIILGSNGSGKSSIYNVIEYNYCKKIGEAQLRSSNIFDEEDNRFKDYLCHYNEPYNSCFAEIETIDENFTLQGANIPIDVRKRINPDTHFISDYDIFYNGRLDYLSGTKDSFHNLIAESLGLKELLQFERNILSFLSYNRITESKRIGGLERSIKQEKEIIANSEEAIQVKKSQLVDLERNQEKKSQDDKKQILQKVLTQIKSNDFSFVLDYKRLLDSIDEFKKDYEILSTQEENTASLSEVQFLTLGLELLKETIDCPFCENSQKKVSEININVLKRLDKIQSFNKLNQAINKSFNIVTENLINLFNRIAILKSKLTIELNLIKAHSEFTELSSVENSLINIIEALQADEFFTDGSKMEEIESFKLNKNNFLFNFFETNKEIIQDSFKSNIEIISKFDAQRSELINRIERLAFADPVNKSTFEQIVTLKNEIAALTNQIKLSNQKVKDSDLELNLVREQQLIYNTIKEDARIFSTHFHTLLNKEVLEAFKPIKSIVEQVLKTYLEHEQRAVDIEIKMQPDEIDNETGEILSEIITASIKPKNNLHPSLPVNKYFNTFHYRLFSTMVGVSIAMASRIITKINLPLVLDDIFYASDFANRATIERFIKELFDLFEEYTPDLELQLILFTHDQLIFESAAKATAKTKIPNVIFAKLFPSKNSKDKGDYRELVYRMQEYLPYKIMQNTLIN
ncbi:MAG: hypothetical protein JWQ63_1852 [Mucilaginibacter sp.]|nr:hypothetical protein [Mucilaginibacter sp.]